MGATHPSPHHCGYQAHCSRGYQLTSPSSLMQDASFPPYATHLPEGDTALPPPHSLVSLPFSTWLAQRNSVRSSSWWFLYQSSITSSNSSTSTSHCGVQHQGLAKRRHPTLSRTPGYTMTHGEIGRQV